MDVRGDCMLWMTVIKLKKNVGRVKQKIQNGLKSGTFCIGGSYNTVNHFSKAESAYWFKFMHFGKQ